MENRVNPEMEAKILEGQEVAKSFGQSIAFPEARVWRDVIVSETVVTDLRNYKSKHVKEWACDEFLRNGRIRKGTGRAYLESFMTGHHARRGSFDIVPTQQTIDYIAFKMMLSDQYRINLLYTVRDNGTALIYAQYNQISGSRWIAIIDASTIPRAPEE